MKDVFLLTHKKQVDYNLCYINFVATLSRQLNSCTNL